MISSVEKAARIARCSVIPGRPYHVQWLLTRKCNYRCRGCNVWREQDSKELTTDEVKKGLKILKELDVVDIVFSGGNPLLREDIGEILEYASRYFVTTIYDNGSMAEKKIDELRRADFVAISLDTLDARKNDCTKGVKGSWRKATHAIDALHKEGINVSVSPTISQFNLDEIVGFSRYFVEKDIPVWYCLYSYDGKVDCDQLFRIGRKQNEYEISDKKAMVNVVDAIIEMKKKHSNILITNKLLKAVKNLYMYGERTWKCRALSNFFMINHLGKVAGCHVRQPVASIFDLPNEWNSTKLNMLRKTYNECTRCVYLCYIFYSLHGSVLGNLQLARDRWRNAGLLLKKRSFAIPSSAIPK